MSFCISHYLTAFLLRHGATTCGRWLMLWMLIKVGSFSVRVFRYTVRFIVAFFGILSPAQPVQHPTALLILHNLRCLLHWRHGILKIMPLVWRSSHMAAETVKLGESPLTRNYITRFCWSVYCLNLWQKPTRSITFFIYTFGFCAGRYNCGHAACIEQPSYFMLLSFLSEVLRARRYQTDDTERWLWWDFGIWHLAGWSSLIVHSDVVIWSFVAASQFCS